MKPSKANLLLRLNYNHSGGDLVPYFDALRDGRALGARCQACDRVWVPPRMCCPNDGAVTEPHEMSGSGEVVAMTQITSVLPFTDTTNTHIFVLVALDGADNRMFGRMAEGHEDIAVDARVCLRGCDGYLPDPVHPAQAAVFEKGPVG
jgi:uncharacterized OB-fold protein